MLQSWVDTISDQAVANVLEELHQLNVQTRATWEVEGDGRRDIADEMHDLPGAQHSIQCGL